jgi:hypothetical protein
MTSSGKWSCANKQVEGNSARTLPCESQGQIARIPPHSKTKTGEAFRRRGSPTDRAPHRSGAAVRFCRRKLPRSLTLTTSVSSIAGRTLRTLSEAGLESLIMRPRPPETGWAPLVVPTQRAEAELNFQYHFRF